MGSKITIIGAGSVGSTIAHLLSLRSFVSDIVMIDIMKDKADGEVMDMIQGTGFREPVSMISGTYEDAKDSDIVVVTSGVARKPGQTRIELAQTNVNIMKDIAPKISKEAPKAKYIVVANPVDVLTYAFLKYSGLPECQVMGSGTLLDTIRLTYRLSEDLKIAQMNIKGFVFGEHGDSAFIPWSITTIEGVQMDEYLDCARKMGLAVNNPDKDAVLTYVHKSGGEIIKRKGATFYGVANSVVNMCEALVSAGDVITVISSMMHGEYGISNVCTSCLTVVGPDGVKGKLEPKLTEEEVALFRKSADALKAVIDSLNIPE